MSHDVDVEGSAFAGREVEVGPDVVHIGCDCRYINTDIFGVETESVWCRERQCQRHMGYWQSLLRPGDRTVDYPHLRDELLTLAEKLGLKGDGTIYIGESRCDIDEHCIVFRGPDVHAIVYRDTKMIHQV